MKCGKKAGNKGWHLLMEDLGCQAEEFEICPAGSNGTIVANKCVFVVVVFSGFSTSRADSTLEFSQLFCFFFFFHFFSHLFSSTGTSSLSRHIARDLRYVRQAEKPK